MPVAVQIILVLAAIAGLTYTVGRALSSVQKQDITDLKNDIAKIDAKLDRAVTDLNTKFDTAIAQINNKFDTYLFGELAKIKPKPKPKRKPKTKNSAK